MEVVMQKWEYIRVHVEISNAKIVASANGEQVLNVKSSAVENDLTNYLDSLGADGWEMISAQKNEYGFQNYFFKRPID
jgi:hypothetical protein